MTGQEHYREGERLLLLAQNMMTTATENTITQAAASAGATAAMAQAHFAAAQVVATQEQVLGSLT